MSHTYSLSSSCCRTLAPPLTAPPSQPLHHHPPFLRAQRDFCSFSLTPEAALRPQDMCDHSCSFCEGGDAPATPPPPPPARTATVPPCLHLDWCLTIVWGLQRSCPAPPVLSRRHHRHDPRAAWTTRTSASMVSRRPPGTYTAACSTDLLSPPTLYTGLREGANCAEIGANRYLSMFTCQEMAQVNWNDEQVNCPAVVVPFSSCFEAAGLSECYHRSKRLSPAVPSSVVRLVSEYFLAEERERECRAWCS